MDVVRPDVVVVASSAATQNVGAWDVQTSTYLTTYKNNTCGRNALALLGQDHFVAAQAGKGPAIHTWAWHKDQVHLQSFGPEPLASLACSKDAAYCAAGSSRGNIFIWEVGSGKLVRIFSGHYKSVTVLAFTADSSALITGGEDAVLSVWLMMELLDASAQHNPPGSSPQPLHSWAQHTLPLTALAIGAGTSNPMLASCSLDRTCKIWSLASGHLLHSVTLPIALLSITLDRWEHSVFLGASDGRIFEVALLRGLNEGEGPLDTLTQAGIHTLAGHSRAVTSLATTTSGYNLVSGSEDGSVRVWDIQTKQTLSVIQTKMPVSCLLVLKRPPYILSGQDRESGKKGPPRGQPVAMLQKYVDVSEGGKRWQGPPMLLDGAGSYMGAAIGSGLLRNDSTEDTSIGLSAAGAGMAETERLLAEKHALEAQVQSAMATISELRAVNAKMHTFMESNLSGVT